MALLVTISLLATVFESGQLAGVLVAQVAIWAGVACAASRLGGLVTLGVGWPWPWPPISASAKSRRAPASR
jgi:hypothetical protein